jgi:hypothetical protein
MNYSLLKSIVSNIKGVGLNEAYISIESWLAPAVMSYASMLGWYSSFVYWNYPEGLYIGTEKEPKDLTVISLKF